jgi:serine/threonine protein kinase
VKKNPLFQYKLFFPSQLNHPNLIKLYGITLNPLQMVLEYAPHSDLRKLLDNKRKEKLTFKLKLKIALDIAKAIAFMHSKYITHRDVRSPNIFVGKVRK